MIKQWRPIMGFPNYEVSNHGYVRNTKFNRAICDEE